MSCWMVFLLAVAVAAISAAAVLLFLVWPGRAPGGSGWIRRWRYAHRGLFTRDQQVPENSTAAFAAAIEAGCGIELDVALTADRRLVVFHDDSLDRMCGRPGRIWELPYGELAGLGLAGTAERVPLFSDVLSLVDGRVPLIVEVKSSPLRQELCQAVAGMLDTYPGRFCVESFDPLIVGWFRRNRPGILRGQLAGRGGSGSRWSRLQWLVLRYLLVDVVGRPHFIAYRVNDMDNPSYRLCRRLGALTVGWTVRDAAGWSTAVRCCDAVIFEIWEGMPEMGGGERTGSL